MDKSPIVFASPLFWKGREEKWPDFVRGKLSIDIAKFNNFLKENADFITAKGYMNFNLNKSQKGNYYFQVDTWKPTPKPDTTTSKGFNGEVIDANDIQI